MRKASRLFEIIQILRLARKPVTAQEIADSLEVVPRTIYRDIAALQAMRVPVEGGRGIGYILRPGFHLPPLMFSIEEMEAVVLALALLERMGDPGLKAAAKGVSRKIAGSVPDPLRGVLEAKSLFAWGSVAEKPEFIDLDMVREAVRSERKLWLRYRDERGAETERIIWPLALIYYSQSMNIVAWCELRHSLRHFRADRVCESRDVDEFFKGRGDILRQNWIAGWQTS